MRKESFYTIVSDIGHPEDVIPKNIKIQSLNSLKFKIEALQKETTDQLVLNSLNTILVSIEDAYQIYMYRFQFQLFVNVINKEIFNAENIIAFAKKI